VPERVFTHLLVPTDGSAASVAAARTGIRLARVLAARLDLLYVVDTFLADELRRFDASAQGGPDRELDAHGRRYLAMLADEAERAGVAAGSAVRTGDPFEEIVAHAHERGVDLIVMGHVGRRSRSRVLLGSVAERVLEFAPCPVLVVKGAS
jgi:nucleotide-binding universal stress UspA family protein